MEESGIDFKSATWMTEKLRFVGACANENAKTPRGDSASGGVENVEIVVGRFRRTIGNED